MFGYSGICARWEIKGKCHVGGYRLRIDDLVIESEYERSLIAGRLPQISPQSGRHRDQNWTE